ncbi:D-alanine--D-alanine ligase family protein [Wansuia hejianensis]|uniref:D-alanine--D-alanine ligase n=1 Tax=Wansuia hejianensis TaxID=2763667 RepID=A0A926F3X5_9FIRM|nr:D-alanine--D-alanine ligase family protein [Wansuia hejianensis]MBC8591439.1 D-alanine--D-alanine ligase [Wansuia hejianensis]
MKKVGVIFGGRSVEHEVSVITGMQIIENIDKTKYQVVPIYITKEGKWLIGECLLDFKNFKNNNLKDAKEIFMTPSHGNFNLYANPEEVGLFGKKILDTIDIIFPALHGTHGEDGSIQGLFELMDIPYVGGGVLASSVGMDKILMKDVFKANNLPIVDFYWFYRSDWKDNNESIVNNIENKLKYPVFVKPANLGSSIGINIAKDREGLIKAIEIAVNYDRKIIIEQAVQNPREINCAVLGYDEEIITSLCEEPLGWEDVLTFEDKYVKSNSKGTKTSGERRIIPADISDELRERIEDLAKKSFKAIDGRGTSRIDFLIDQEQNVFINEINTLPGSIGFYLWEGKGYPFKKLVDKLIDIALVTHEEKKKNMYNYDANLFNRIQYGGKM